MCWGRYVLHAMGLPRKSVPFDPRFWFVGGPIRGKKYHYALEPKILPPGTQLDINDPLLYKTVEPISKWRHSSKNWDPVVSKMMGMMLYDGERETAREVMRKTFAEIKFIQFVEAESDAVEVSPIKIVNQAVTNCSPLLVLHSVRRGGFIYKVPAPPQNETVSRHMAIRWILEAARNKDKNKRIWVSLAHELINAANNEGAAIAWRYRHHAAVISEGSIRKIRNVGLIAHIDAGKTTTTEQMLFLAGRTRAVGEVDRGDTVTDYLAEERERGISIMSAAACLTWRQHDIHLIDTPGHVDFTFEVERGLTAVDSTLVIIDACKGVETQTRTVWSQADRYQLPRLIFINKMDRPMANITNCLHSLRQRFGGAFFLLQMPICIRKDRFVGIVDLPSLSLKIWPTTTKQDSRCFSQTDLLKFLASKESQKSGELAGVSFATVVPLALKARGQLLASLAELDDAFANEYLLLDTPESLLPADVVHDCVKRVTTSSRGFPVVLGSSRRNVGIQPVLDGIVDYLPDPSQRSPPPLIASVLSRVQRSTPREGPSPPILLTFKILFDPQRGPLSLTRVFSGYVTPGMLIKNWTRHDLDDASLVEKIGTLLQLTGDTYEVVDCAGAGHIVALSGLKSTRTGDILGPVTPNSLDAEEDEGMDRDADIAFIPQPVVHAALEPRSSSAFRNLEHALECVQREDPSFKATFDKETGQWVVAGMGDLHLEVVLARLRREYRLEVKMGPLLTSHKEMPQAGYECRGSAVSTGLIGGRQRTIFVELDAFSDGRMSASDRPRVTFEKGWNLEDQKGSDSSGDVHQSVASQHKVIMCVRQGCEVALATGGPLLRSRVLGVGVRIRRVGQLSSATADTAALGANLTRLQVPLASQNFSSFAALLRSTVMKAQAKALAGLPEWKIIEPVMTVEIQIPLDDDSGPQDASLAPFLGELARRRGEVETVEMTESDGHGGGKCCLRASAPLAELSGFSAVVRSLSSGRAEIVLHFARFQPVSAERQIELLRHAPPRPSSRTCPSA
ncbi:Ribosome-releasing factor 2 mitochondrial [Taenia crassiceps]|uniref:Ribosome-releasing factor 2 mitochondrial n=1 Tax=Taenia crassiceps TaxID=6207 RepID=A0ABR4QCH7_9CEST